jgi:hypothetical protein
MGVVGPPGKRVSSSVRITTKPVLVHVSKQIGLRFALATPEGRATASCDLVAHPPGRIFDIGTKTFPRATPRLPANPDLEEDG